MDLPRGLRDALRLQTPRVLSTLKSPLTANAKHLSLECAGGAGAAGTPLPRPWAERLWKPHTQTMSGWIPAFRRRAGHGASAGGEGPEGRVLPGGSDVARWGELPSLFSGV